MEKALFINGVYESVLEEINKSKEKTKRYKTEKRETAIINSNKVPIISLTAFSTLLFITVNLLFIS